MNKKIIALIATGAILATAVAAGCAAQKKTNPVKNNKKIIAFLLFL